MIRTLAVLSLGAILLFALGAPFGMLQPGMLVLGGHYRVGPGETIKEDMNFYFAQVTIEEGALVEGHVFLFSSTLTLAGQVSEDIHAFESDLTLRETARVDGEIGEKDFIHWTVLLPASARIP
jgi:hypothetical protein